MGAFIDSLGVRTSDAGVVRSSIIRWLNAKGFGELGESFIKARISGDALLTLKVVDVCSLKADFPRSLDDKWRSEIAALLRLDSSLRAVVGGVA